jgi:hypothetical protein
MKNNEYDEEDDNFEGNFDDNNFNEFLDGDYKNIFSQQNALEGFHLHLQEKKISISVLAKSIKICEKNIFWNFYKINTKLNKIKQVYESFINMLKIEE